MGRERARQHIEDARRLTQELGGADKDVKEYFFSLPPDELCAILDAYEKEHGRKAREYAEETLPRWRNGRVTMSGMVASRLFNLLPPRMPLTTKYKLAENLWRHVGPSSRKTLRVGLNSDVDGVVSAVRDHIDGVVVSYKIPSILEKRFGWLSAGDVQVKQLLLNHLHQMEKSLVVEGARVQLPIMLDHLHIDDQHHTHRLAQILKIGKHEIELVIDRRSEGMTWAEPGISSSATSPSVARGRGFGWLWWVAGGVLLLFLFAR